MSTRSTRSKKAENCESLPSNTSKKRILSPEINTDQNTNVKKNKPSKMTSKDMDELKSLITATRNGIENRICESHNVLELKFNELGNRVKSDVQLIKKSVDEFKTRVGSDISEIKKQLNEHEQRFENTDDDFERLKLSQDLRVIGIAFKDNENLIELFNKIASKIGFNIEQCSTVPSLERIPVRNKTTKQMIPSNTILIHFAIQRQKQLFYSCYLNKMPLDPTKFNLAAEQRIILSENVTRKNAKLFKVAQTLRKEEKLAQTYTEYGLVKIKFKLGNFTQYEMISHLRHS